MKQKACVSFDYEKDRKYYYLLKAWANNEKFSFNFSDCTPSEIQSYDIGRIKAVLTMKIDEASHLLVIVGEDANKKHPDSSKIGYTNWQNYEIAKAKELKKKIVAVKINNKFESPSELLNSGAKWAYSFEEEQIENALNEA